LAVCTHLSQEHQLVSKTRRGRSVSKSDEGRRDEAISEVTAFFESMPDHEKELAAASERFAPVLRTAPVETTKGLARHSPRALFGACSVVAMGTFSSLAGRLANRPGASPITQSALLGLCSVLAFSIGAIWLVANFGGTPTVAPLG
jgi:hypothetical protein